MGYMPLQREKAWAREGDIHAFAWLAAKQQLVTAPKVAAAALPLAGLTFGVKDVMDVRGMPTQHGCAGLSLKPADWDATVVAQLRAAGAFPVGKTVTAEFAYTAPGPTRNPWNLAHTPGGSSSGSAAAVAAGMVDFAVGTQTGGSIIRPAAFCGVVGFKPSFGLVHRQGMLVTAESLDTIGWFTPDVPLSARILSVITQTAPIAPRRPLRVAYAAAISGLTPDTMHLLETVKRCLLDAGIALQDLAHHQPLLDELTYLHGVTVSYELARGMQGVANVHGDLLSRGLQSAIREGMAKDTASYLKTQERRHALARQWMREVGEADLIIAPSSHGAAPLGLHSTGSSLPNRPWSLLGWPCVHIPLGSNAAGLPLGVQLIARPMEDAQLLAMAATVQSMCVESTYGVDAHTAALCSGAD